MGLGTVAKAGVGAVKVRYFTIGYRFVTIRNFRLVHWAQSVTMDSV